MSILVYPYAFVFPPLEIHQYQAFLMRPFWISHCLSFKPPLWRPTQLHPPVTLMVYSHINQLIKSKFQWWINLPELMRWSAACCYQSTCCQVIVSCWDVWYYEVHLEAQLSYNGFNRSKSISVIGRLSVIYVVLQKHPPYVSSACWVVSEEWSHFHLLSLRICWTLTPCVPLSRCG